MNTPYTSDQNLADLLAVLAKYPDLTKNGFDPWFPLSGPPDHQAEILAGQAAFLEAGGVSEFGRARCWLAGRARRLTVNRGRTSYSWKHVAELAEGAYVSNGSLIAAALADGFPVGRRSGSLNAWLGIGRRLDGKKNLMSYSRLTASARAWEASQARIEGTAQPAGPLRRVEGRA